MSKYEGVFPMETKSFHVMTMTENQGQAICGWRYAPPYDIYNWPSWQELTERQEEFADPSLRVKQYAALIDDQGELCGFAQYFPLVGVTRIGLGMRPDLCGKGNGSSFVKAIVEEARRRKPDDEIDLEVLAWNERARKSYERAGFSVTDQYERLTPKGTALFYCMVYKAASPE
jgi:ribosomal-protein-alanine N-acetyltransferase